MNVKKFGLGLVFTMLSTLASPLHAELSPTDKEEINKMIHQYLTQKPEVLKEALQALQTQEWESMESATQKAILEHSDILFQSKTSPTIAPAKPTVTVVEFFDYQCKYCKKMRQDLNQFFEKNTDIRMVYKELPVLGETSIVASKAALAAHKQNKYMDFHNRLMQEESITEQKIYEIAKELKMNLEQLKKDMESKEIMAELRSNIQLARDLGLRGTPALIVAPYPTKVQMKSMHVPGAITAEQLNEVVTRIKTDNNTQIN
ncbi:MAG TPA: DsbA family protein [Gammaproteobacteria bacterium]|nr:DsbA family protein [Gammaproteobacteria bacterium]